MKKYRIRPMQGEVFQKIYAKPNRFKKRHKRMNKHHLTPKSRFGDMSPNNLLLIDIEKHNLLHKIFGNRTWEEIIAVMVRVSQMKRRHKLLDSIDLDICA